MPKTTATKSRLSPRSAKKVGPTPAAKGHTRHDQVLAMLRRKRGVSIDEMVAAFGVLPHSARAMISISKRRAVIEVVLAEGRYRSL